MIPSVALCYMVSYFGPTPPPVRKHYLSTCLCVWLCKLKGTKNIPNEPYLTLSSHWGSCIIIPDWFILKDHQCLLFESRVLVSGTFHTTHTHPTCLLCKARMLKRCTVLRSRLPTFFYIHMNIKVHLRVDSGFKAMRVCC